MALLWRRAEFLTNWERGILQLSAGAKAPAGLLEEAERMP